MKELALNLNATHLQTVANNVLNEAKKKGATQAAVSIAANKGFSVSAHDRDVEKVEYHQDKIIEIEVYFGKRLGAASISDIRPEAIRSAVEAACHIAKFTDEDPASGLATPEELAQHYPHLELAFPWDISVEEAIKLACECEREALSHDKRIISAEEVSVTTGEGLHLYATSNGFNGFYPFTRHELSCILVAKEGEDMQRDYSYTVAADPKLLVPATQVAKRAVDRTVARLGARQIPTMKAPVTFAAEEARSLLGHFISAISGGSLYRKASFLVDHLGKQIFPEFVHIQEFPFLDRALGSAPFDDEGLPTRENIFIENGVLNSYCLNVYAARKLGMTSTGNGGGVHNLSIKTSDKDLAAILKQMDRGLLITELMGSSVNPLTGDYSRGAAGYWVEGGVIQYPVSEITIASTLQTMYKNLVAIGNDIDHRGNVLTGSILLEEMMIAGA